MKRLTDKEVESLRESCAAIAHLNWDGGCLVEQKDDGSLTIQTTNEDEEVESTLHARFLGEYETVEMGSHDLWALRTDEMDTEIVSTLVPSMIMGLMGL